MAKDLGKFTLSVLNEQGVLYYGDCTVLFVPGKKEIVAILAHHTPMIMKLEEGKIEMKLDHAKTTITTIKSGIVYVADNEVAVLANL